MIIGVPKEIKEMENRVGATPAGVNELTRNGNQVLVEAGAGAGSGFADEAYRDAGATITDNVREVWGAEMVYKVKEPLEDEYGYFRSDLMLFTYLHLAAEGPLTKALVDNKVNSVAYETVQLEDGSLPLLTPMSEVAGRMAVQVGARFLEKPQGGQGVLLGGVPGIHPAMVVIIGGGVVGINSAKMADVTPKNRSFIEFALSNCFHKSENHDEASKHIQLANKNKLIQVFVNLIENSISLSPKGSQILIELNKLEEDKIGITFYDQGVGVELKSSERIFDRFYTDRQNNLKNHTGLGLSIAREIITHMNGKITLKKSDKSDYSGACFLIILPVRHF